MNPTLFSTLSHPQLLIIVYFLPMFQASNHQEWTWEYESHCCNQSLNAKAGITPYPR